MTTNAQLAESALAEYQRLKKESLESFEESIVDLITDLLHLAHRENLDGPAISDMAWMNFRAESAASGI
jgi:hypothetical protein